MIIDIDFDMNGFLEILYLDSSFEGFLGKVELVFCERICEEIWIVVLDFLSFLFVDKLIVRNFVFKEKKCCYLRKLM